jgi:FixJ family two-component response regulator
MPDMDGSECAFELLKIRADLPIVLASGFLEQSFADSLNEQGIRGFLQKPFGLAMLRTKVAEAIGLELPDKEPGT